MNLIAKLKTLFNLIILNLKIFYEKNIFKNKIILFYYPKSKQINENSYFIEKLFEKLNINTKVIFLHQNITFSKKNYFFVSESKLNFLTNSNLFISNFICDNFPNKTKKIYIHHNLYDDPWVSLKKEKETCSRLKNYDYIFVASKEAVIGTKKMFEKSFLLPPKIYETGYYKLDFFLQNKKKIQRKNYILIAPTGINGFSKLTMVKDLKIIIEKIFLETKYNIILRPHPRDRNNDIYNKIRVKYSNNDKFEFDTSPNYYQVYSKSKLMITDISGTAYTYAFLTLSPVIFYSISDKILKKYNYSNLNFFKNRNKIGVIINSHKKLVKNISLIEKKYSYFSKSSLNLRKKLKYLNKSKYIIKEIIKKIT